MRLFSILSLILVLASAAAWAGGAARMGDPTAHGGMIVSGFPSVLIGGGVMAGPAARVTDMHTCPASENAVPHVGGPIVGPGFPTVLIGGLPAARVGDGCTCTGPQDTITSGSATVFIGP